MAELVNTYLDHLMSLTWRLLDFPLYVLFPVILLIILLFRGLLSIFIKKADARKNILQYFYFIASILLILLVIDVKINLLQKENTAMSLRLLSANTSNELQQTSHTGSSQYIALKNRLSADLDSLKIWQRSENEAIELITLRKKNPEAVAFIGIIDLEYPNLKICITPEQREKYFTSDFAKTHDCDIAINGEAGESMYNGCALGEWTGNWIVEGKAILSEDSPERPFLSFDRLNHSKYFKASIVDTTNTEEKFNTLWGRFDLLLQGQYVVNEEKERPYCRTIMAINKEGTKLFLMVVDGKRTGYSLGLSYEECAKVLLSMGAWEGMACDQGGSACMYLKSVNGLVSRPADSGGIERPIYTHFGVKVN